MTRWAGKKGNVESLVMRLEAAIQYGLEGAMRSLALQVLQHRKQIFEGDRSMAAQLAVPRVLIVLAKFGKKEDIPFIVQLLERPSPSSSDTFAPQDRDTALGLIVQLSGHRPEDYALRKCEGVLVSRECKSRITGLERLNSRAMLALWGMIRLCAMIVKRLNDETEGLRGA